MPELTHFDGGLRKPACGVLDEIGTAYIDMTDHPLGEAILPNTLIVPFHVYLRLGRFMMTKRRWRRWKAKQRAQMRAWHRQIEGMQNDRSN